MRATILVSGAAGLLFALGLAAHADVANPASTYQSAFKIAQVRQPPAPAVAEPAPAKARAPVARVEPDATPVPEQFVSEAPAPVVVQPRHGSVDDSAVARIVFGAEARYREIEAFFGRVATAGQDLPGAGAGVPALVLGILSVAAVLDHHRLMGRWAADENALELLYARELTPPG